MMKKNIKYNLLFLLICISLIIVPSICNAQSGESHDFTGYSNDSYDDEDSDDSEAAGQDYYDEYTDDEYSDEEYSDEKQAPVAEPEKPRLKPGVAINLKEKTIRFGRIPYLSIRQMMSQVVPLLGLLKKKTEAKSVHLVSTGINYARILDALRRGNIDFAWVSPIAYLKNRDKDNLMAIAKSKFGNKTGYRGVFIAPAKGRVQGLEDLKNSTIGFVDPQSASGYIYPMYLLRYLKIDLGTKSKIKFLKNHNNVLRAVLKGKVDAGCCLEATIAGYMNKVGKHKLIILAKTPEIPSDVIVCRQDCPINLRERFQQALIAIKPGDLPAGSPSFLAACDDDFAPVEAIMNFLGLIK